MDVGKKGINHLNAQIKEMIVEKNPESKTRIKATNGASIARQIRTTQTNAGRKIEMGRIVQSVWDEGSKMEILHQVIPLFWHYQRERIQSNNLLSQLQKKKSYPFLLLKFDTMKTFF